MWHSLTPKVIHVNQRWMVITDDKKVGDKTPDKTLSAHLTLLPPPPPLNPPPQVMYAEFLVASVGSLAYAEDDGRHILAVKVARSPASLRGGLGLGEGVECHVLECESEVGSLFVSIILQHL